MASAPSRKPRSNRPQEDMALMSLEEIRDTQRFFNEYEKNGPGFLVAEVRDRKMFQESFDRLLRKGCRPSVLFLGLHHLRRFERREKSCQHPGKRELRSLETSLRKTVEDIRTFEKKYVEAHRVRVQSHSSSLRGPGEYEFELYVNRMKSLSRAETVIDSMSSYAEMLRSWWTPALTSSKVTAQFIRVSTPS
jgi:hypothetical protein